MKNALSEQLKELLAHIPEPKRQDLLCAELLNKIKVGQFNERPQSIVLKIIEEVIFLCFSPWSAVPALRTVTYFFIGIVASVTAVAGAHMAGPGDSLYSVKISMERIPLSMPMVSEGTKFDVEIKSAKKRQDEIVEIIASDASAEDKSRKIEEAGKELTRTITSTQKRVREMSQRRDRVATAGAASSLKVSVVEIKQTLDKAVENRDTGNSSENSEEIAQALEKIYAAASVVELSSLEAMVDAVNSSQPKQGEDKNAAVPVKENEVDNKEESKSGTEGDVKQNAVDTSVKKENVTPIKETIQESQEKVVKNDENAYRNQVEDELKNAIADLNARVSQLSADQTTATEAEDGKKKDVIDTTDVTFDVAEALRLEVRQEKIGEIKETVELAESSLKKGDFKGTLEYIRKAQELLISVEQK